MSEKLLVPSQGTPYFGQYGKAFQEKIFHCLISDKEWASQMVEVMDPSYFDVSYLEYLCEKLFGYHKKYRIFPYLGLLVTIINDELSSTKD